MNEYSTPRTYVTEHPEDVSELPVSRLTCNPALQPERNPVGTEHLPLQLVPLRDLVSAGAFGSEYLYGISIDEWRRWR